MSDRDRFWSADDPSAHTQIVQGSDLKSNSDIGEAIADKNVLLLVHGYNTSADTALSNYHTVYDHLTSLEKDYYDVIIGYLWPGEDFGAEYFEAKSEATSLIPRMRSHLQFLSSASARLDLLAHSMGNFLLFEALNYQSPFERKVIQNYFSFAAAIDNESIERKEKYYTSTQNCNNIFVFYSKQDDVLKWLYTFAEQDKALGFDGAENPSQLPPNVEMIDCSSFIDSHGEYYTSPSVYGLIQQLSLETNSTPSLR